MKSSLLSLTTLIMLLGTVLLMPSSLFCIERELIEHVSIEGSRLEVDINHNLKARYFTDDFFVEYDEDIDLEKLDPSLALIPFLSNVMTVLWISGKDYYVDKVDQDFYESSLKMKKILERLYPLTKWSGNLIPRKLVKNYPITTLKDPAKEIAMLFSGGLDSTACSYGNNDKKQHLITMWGQWDVPLNKPGLWQKRKNYFENYAEMRGYTNSFIKSNYVDFLNWNVLEKISPEISSWRVDTTEGLGMMGLALPIMVLKGYPRLVMGSSYHWEYPYPTAANPYIDHKLLMANSFHLLHDQFDISRPGKLALLAKKINENNLPYPYLKVCNGKTAVNCCKSCCKCIPTILGLLALNENPRNYGFAISRKEAFARTKPFLADSHDFDTLWPLGIIKRALKKEIAVSDEWDWFLSTDLYKNVDMSAMKYLKKLNWRTFEPHYPAVYEVDLDNYVIRAKELNTEKEQLPAVVETPLPTPEPTDTSSGVFMSSHLIPTSNVAIESHTWWQKVKNTIFNWIQSKN